jgi:hypothetical protein
MAGSTKFYSPASLDSFLDDNDEDTKYRETQISQDLYNLGYYIYTIDGPRVNVDYYADAVGNFDGGPWGWDYPDGTGSLEMPDLNFEKKESFGYSTNGKQFLVAQGESYSIVKDRFGRTRAKILAGTNNSTTTDDTPTVIDDNDTPDDTSDDTVLSAPRALNKIVNTGWVSNPDFKFPDCHKKHWGRNIWRTIRANLHNKLKSHILSLWGMSEIGAEGKTDNYVLSMSFDALSTFFDYKAMRDMKKGKFGIATYVDGKWVNAVDENFGGCKKFVFGKYKPRYGLGTYGIDPFTKTAWAVINYNADFAIAKNIKPAHKPRRSNKW